MKKLCMLFMYCSTFSLIACSSGGNSISNQNQNPVVTLLSESQLPNSTQICYSGAESFTSQIAGINNNGVVAGAMLNDPDTGCLQQGFLWDSKQNLFSSIPFLSIPEHTVNGARLSAISTNLITGGVTTNNPPQDVATFNIGNIPNDSISAWNYVYGISEDGRYIMGTTLGGSYLFFDTEMNKQIELSYNGKALGGFSAAFMNASNSGKVVGMLQDGNQPISGVICEAFTGICNAVIGGEKDGFDAFITSISANDKYIYGYTHDNLDNMNVFSIDPKSNKVTLLMESFTIFSDNNVTTNDGLIAVTNTDTKNVYIYDPAVNCLFSVNDLAIKLNLPVNTQLSGVHFSPNSNYIVFDVSDYTNNIFAVKVYFPDGVAKYLEDNIPAYMWN